MGSAIEVFRGDDGALVVNASMVPDLGGLPAAIEGQALGGDPNAQKILSAMASWRSNGRPAQRRVNGIFDRDRYVTPTTPYEKILTARRALADDIIGGGANVTEALAFAQCTVKTMGDLHQQDIWNQIAADINLDARLREAWRVLYTDSQVVTATWWGTKEYKSRLKGPGGNPKRSKRMLTVPLHLSILDTTKVTPIGALMFNQERLAFVATAEEAEFIDRVLAHRDGIKIPSRTVDPRRHQTHRYDDYGNSMLAATGPEPGLTMSDPIIERLVTSRYDPPEHEKIQLRDDGVDPTHLFAFDPRFVWRHSLTRPQFQRFADIRLEAAFELLDLKHQLRAMDRAMLIGGANYIVLVTKGSEAHPAEQREINNLQANVHTLGQLPVMVGDHRLDVRIVTPKIDSTLNRGRHDTLDTRIQALVYGTFAATGSDMNDPIKSGRIIASGLEGRRRMLKRGIEAEVFQRTRDANPDTFTERATLRFNPASISLAFDPARAAFMLDMREAREMSRETLHGELGLEQSQEAAQMEREEKEYDDIFRTFVPHGHNPDGDDDGDDGDDGDDDGDGGDRLSRRAQQRRGGRRNGGNRNGGGAAPGTRQGQESDDPRHSRTGPAKRPAAAVTEKIAEYVDLPGDATAEDILYALEHAHRDDVKAVAGEFQIPNRHQMRKGDLAEAIAAIARTDEET